MQITECEPQNVGAALPDEWQDDLEPINAGVNHAIRSVDDVTLYGRAEWWAIPLDGAGDCEDFALLKRRMLMNLGWPSSALLIATTWNHAVLIARTPLGDLILDNVTSDIAIWHRTPYRILMIQSPRDPRQWEAM